MWVQVRFTLPLPSKLTKSFKIPYFCGQVAACWEPGSQWALDRAKQNVLEHYFLVGTTENLSQFVEVLENEIPAIFKVGLNSIAMI